MELGEYKTNLTHGGEKANGVQKYSSLRHCLISKCIPARHSTFRAQDTTHLDPVNPGKTHNSQTVRNYEN